MRIVNLSIIALLILSASMVQAQNPAGQALYFDYDAFQVDNLRRYVNCGNDNSLNPGANLSMEAWVSVYDPAWNQKIFGKLNGSFNSGYVLAVDQGKIYPEIWTPSQSQVLEGFMPPTPNPYYWMHFAVTYDGSNLTAYLNGEEVGQETATGTIATNTEDFIIGIAPWDLLNFQYFGHIDEVRIWNTSRTQQEIIDNMHRELSGSENGLIAYYNFNQTAGTTLPDVSGNGNDGATTNIIDADWQNSNAVLGNNTMTGQNDVSALWNAVGLTDPRFVTTTNGLSVVASGIPAYDYLVFGHDGLTGNSTADLPSGAPANFERINRVWYTNRVGTMSTDLLFDLDDAASGGTGINDGESPNNYVLLYRSGTSGDFTAVANGDARSGSIVTFNGYEVQDGYYTIGVGDPFFSSIPDYEFVKRVYPNPAADRLYLELTAIAQNASVRVFSFDGKLVLHEQLSAEYAQNLDISTLQPGSYRLSIEVDNQTENETFVITR